MTTTTREAKIAQAKALTASKPTRTLAGSLRMIKAKIDADPQHADGAAWRLTHSWIIGELETRYPAASDAVEAAFIAAEDDPSIEVDYVAVLLGAIPVAEL